MAKQNIQAPGKSQTITKQTNPEYLFILNHGQLLFFLGYSLVLCILVGPELKWDYDGHDLAFLMASSRIHAGQVPFRDFYPWYGPLYHYLLAWFNRLFGTDLYAVKLYIDFVNPLLSIIVVLIILRNFRLPLVSRLFVLAATIYLGLERIYYCGSLRAFLPVLLISWLYNIFQKRQKIPYLFIFPAAGLLFFFSPESGTYAMLTSIIFAVTAAIYLRSRKETLVGLGYLGVGLGITLVAMLCLYWGTSWFRNYLEYFSVIGPAWRDGLSFPRPRLHPRYLLDLTPAVIYLFGLASIIFSGIRNRRLSEHSFMVWLLVILGACLSIRGLLKFHPTYVQFGFLPAIIIAGLIWAPPNQPVKMGKTITQVLLVLALIFARPVVVPPIFPPYHGEDYKSVLGVRVSPKDGATYEKIQGYYREFSRLGKVGLVLPSPYITELGQVPPTPFDTLFSLYYPKYQQLFFSAVKNGGYQYLIVNEKDFSWDYPRESVEVFFDYLDANYLEVQIERPIHVFKLRDHPINPIVVVKNDPGPFILDRSNNFSTILKVPSGGKVEFVDFQAAFKYEHPFLTRFSIPIVKLTLDDRKWTYPRREPGAQRIDPMPGEHPYRAYLYFPVQNFNLLMAFPGLLNPAPEQIVITNARWSYFDLDVIFPREIGYAGP